MDTKYSAFDEFSVWFEKQNSKYWRVYDLSCDNKIVGKIDSRVFSKEISVSEGFEPNENDSMDSNLIDVISKDAQMFTSRPEYITSTISSISSNNIKLLYNTALVGCALMRAKHNGVTNPDNVIDKVMNCINWLNRTDFYQAPASTIYHESEPEGLLKHTLKVVINIIQLHDLPKFNNMITLCDAILVALVHDWCKIGMYEMYTRNVKNEQTGIWEKIPAYRRKDTSIPLGHGVTSLYLAQKFFKLAIDEALAVRWHQGRWNVCEAEQNEFQHANETYPLVHMLQFADQLAIVSY